MNKKHSYRDRSVFIHGKFHTHKWEYHTHILPPITTSTAYRLGSVERGAQGFQEFANPELNRDEIPPIYIYSRLDEPCVSFLEQTLAFAEKGETAVAFATGMAAISASICINTKAGDHIVAHKTLYGCTYTLMNHWLKRFNISCTLVDFTNIEALKNSITPNTRALFFETPCNPNLKLVDIEEIVDFIQKINKKRSEKHKIVTLVDNTFATPFCQRPLLWGIDFVIHSLTKNLGGFGADMGGVVIAPKKSETDLLLFRKDFGATLSPTPAWNIFVYGISTLFLRIEKQQKNAIQIAQFLNLHPKIKKVWYPGLEDFDQYKLAQKQMRDVDGNFAPGSLLYFEMEGEPKESYENAVKLINSIAKNALSITMAVSLGQIRTLIEHPASMTHALIPPDKQIEADINPGGVRISVGIEDIRDILADLDASLANV